MFAELTKDSELPPAHTPRPGGSRAARRPEPIQLPGDHLPGRRRALHPTCGQPGPEWAKADCYALPQRRMAPRRRRRASHISLHAICGRGWRGGVYGLRWRGGPPTARGSLLPARQLSRRGAMKTGIQPNPAQAQASRRCRSPRRRWRSLSRASQRGQASWSMAWRLVMQIRILGRTVRWCLRMSHRWEAGWRARRFGPYLNLPSSLAALISVCVHLPGSLLQRRSLPP